MDQSIFCRLGASFQPYSTAHTDLLFKAGTLLKILAHWRNSVVASAFSAPFLRAAAPTYRNPLRPEIRSQRITTLSPQPHRSRPETRGPDIVKTLPGLNITRKENQVKEQPPGFGTSHSNGSRVFLVLVHDLLPL